MGRTVAIGDVHGCASALRTLLDLVQPTSADCIVTLGDYVDRGEDSRDVIQQLIDLSGRCQLVPLLGNHELMMLASRDNPTNLPFWRHCGGVQTIASYGGSLDKVPDEHWDFLEDCRTHFETDTHLFVHANYSPNRPPHEFTENDLFWRHLNGFPPPAPHQSGKRVIMGHTPQPGRVLDMGHALCIDTHCFGTGCLTGLNVDNGEIWQVDKLGKIWSSPASA